MIKSFAATGAAQVRGGDGPSPRHRLGLQTPAQVWGGDGSSPHQRHGLPVPGVLPEVAGINPLEFGHSAHFGPRLAPAGSTGPKQKNTLKHKKTQLKKTSPPRAGSSLGRCFGGPLGEGRERKEQRVEGGKRP